MQLLTLVEKETEKRMTANLRKVFTAIFSLLVGYLTVQNSIKFPVFKADIEVRKLVREKKSGKRSDVFKNASKEYMEKIVEYAGLSHEIHNYWFFRIVKVPLIDGESLYWIGVLGNYYFLKTEQTR